MQTASIKSMNCKCGKETSATLVFESGKEISIHFTKKSTYWHIYEAGKITRTYKKPACWN